MRDAFTEVTPRPEEKSKACTPGDGEFETSTVDETSQLPVEAVLPTSSLSVEFTCLSVSGLSGQSAGLVLVYVL